MKFFFPLFLLLCNAKLFAQNIQLSNNSMSPLVAYSKIWNDAKYSACNTAANVTYLGKTEKEAIYILNLVRAYPALFTKTVLSRYPDVSGNGYLASDSFYFLSLVNTLRKMEPLNMLYPDKNCFESASCHAYNSGITGYVGHDRKTKDCKAKKFFYGECCDYGHNDALDIVLSLLIDEGIPSLGHRNIFLSNYTKLGVSIQPHKRYGYNAVFDFAW